MRLILHFSDILRKGLMLGNRMKIVHNDDDNEHEDSELIDDCVENGIESEKFDESESSMNQAFRHKRLTSISHMLLVAVQAVCFFVRNSRVLNLTIIFRPWNLAN